MTITVVGAGIIGLSCARELANNGHKVRIVSAHWSDGPLASEYTSSWAGAHFRPFPSKSEQERLEADYTRTTYQRFKQLVETNPECGIKFVTGVDLIEKLDQYYKSGYGYHYGLEDYTVLDDPSVEFAASYKSWVLNPPVYLGFLQRQLVLQNVEFVRARMKSLKQVFESFPDTRTVVNATGDGLGYEGGLDPKGIPIRGQTLLVRPVGPHAYENKTITHQGADGNWTFVIPRPFDGGVVIGGTKQPDDLYPFARDEDTEQVISRTKKIFPELVFDKILRTNVGFRPARQGGSRVEKETIGGKHVVVHAYGLGGSGYEMSMGVAEKVASLVTSCHSKL